MKKRSPHCPTCGQTVGRRTAVVDQKLDAARRAKRKQDRKSGKYEARRAVYWAVKLGLLAKGGCADHGTTACQGKIEAHHHQGYAPEHWLDVVWLCTRHHQQREWEQTPSPPKRLRTRKATGSMPVN